MRFKVASEADNYRLTLKGPVSSTLGDALMLDRSNALSQNGMQFTTIDRDNDLLPFSCSNFYTG